jgi:DNA-binding MarR family transcriptional regulator
VNHSATSTSLLDPLERVVIGSVGVTAAAVSDAAPDLTLLQWRVVVVLAAAEDGMTVSELARRLGSRVPAMSRLLSRLRARGIVVARKDHPDGRVTTMLLGEPGRALWARVSARRRQDLVVALGDAALDGADVEVLNRLAAAFEAYA